MSWRLSALLVLIAVLVGGGVALLVFGYWARTNSSGLSPAEASGLRLDAIKTALTVAAGIGAGATLLLALRRQALSERAQRFLEDDSRNQRITEQYVAAADQLGSDKAAVRLAGLYALERLAQDTPRLRQTVTDVICAYLRMPYRAEEESDELQVRLTAQRVLAAHTWVPQDADEPETYWWGPKGERMDLDLTGAHLSDFDLTGCRVGQLWLTRAQLHGYSRFFRLHVFKVAALRDAHFHGMAAFGQAHFHSDADFSGAEFDGMFSVGKARFGGHANLHRTRFHQMAGFLQTVFEQRLTLSEVRCDGWWNLMESTVEGDFSAYRSEFGAIAIFKETTFAGKAELGQAVFAGELDLRKVRFARRPGLLRTEIRAAVKLEGTSIGDEPDVTEARLRELLADDIRKANTHRIGDNVTVVRDEATGRIWLGLTGTKEES